MRCIIEKRWDVKLLESNKLPINTLVGTSWDTFRRVTARQQTGRGFKGKHHLTTDVYRLLSTLKPIGDSRSKKLASKPLEMDPLFILGYWRSGTTFVHNIFACDKHFGCTTTYQMVFPHLILWGRPFFEKDMTLLMPDERPTDNMELRVDLPQEEEFALSNITSYTCCNFWLLPKCWMEYCDRYLSFNDITEEGRRIFMDTFIRLAKASLWNTNDTQYLSENPPHTGRVKALLGMFSNAKLIYLKRNLYTVFKSARSFSTSTVQPLRLQDIINKQIEADFIEVYHHLFYRYEEEKHLILEGNLVEVEFEGFERGAFAMMENIYRSLNLLGFKESKADIRKYLSKKKGYKKNQYKYGDRTARLIEEDWSVALKEWGCSLWIKGWIGIKLVEGWVWV